MLFNKLTYLLFFILLNNVSIGQEIKIVTQEKIHGTIHHLAYSPDGTLIASSTRAENSIKVWEVSTGKIIGKLQGHSKPPTDFLFHPKKKQLYSASDKGLIIVWDIIEWRAIDSVRLNAPITTMNFKDDFLHVGTEFGTVHQWKNGYLEVNKPIYTTDHPIKTISSYGAQLAIGSGLGNLVLYNTELQKITAEKKAHLNEIKGLAFYNEGENILSVSSGGKAIFWKSNDLEKDHHISLSTLPVVSFDSNVEKDIFSIVTQNKTIKTWDFKGNKLQEFKSESDHNLRSLVVKPVKISPTGTTLSSAGFQKVTTSNEEDSRNVIRIWDLKRGSLFKTLSGHVNPILTFDFHPKKNHLITLGNEDILTFWNFNLAEKMGAIKLHKRKREVPTNYVKDRATIRNGKKVLGALARLKNGNIGDIKDVLKDNGKSTGSAVLKRFFAEKPLVKFSAQGSFLITKLDGDEIRLYTIGDRGPVYKAPLFSYQPAINQIITSPDEKFLVVLGSGDSAISVVDIQEQKFITKLNTSSTKNENLKLIYEANSVSFSPDGKFLAVCFNTSKTFVYDVSTWQKVFENELPLNIGYVKSPFVNFSEDGKVMVVKSMDGIRKYNTSTFGNPSPNLLKVDGFSVPLDKPSNYAITIKDSHIYFENMFSGNVKKSIYVEPKEITNISVNSDGKFGITFTSGQFILLDPKEGKEEALLVAEGDNYIFKTADNFYKPEFDSKIVQFDSSFLLEI